MDIVTNNSGLRFYRNIGEAHSPVYELQLPKVNYDPVDFDGIGTLYFGEFDGRCGIDMICAGENRGILLWGSRGITPTISFPAPDDSFEDCDSSRVRMSAHPPGGTWGGSAEPDGTFLPSDFLPGAYEMIYTFEDPDGCYTRNDTLFVRIVQCTSSASKDQGRVKQARISPNPADDSFSLGLQLARPGNVKISIVSLLGERFDLYSGFENRSDCFFTFARPKRLAPGFCFILIDVEGEWAAEKMIFR